MGENKQGHNLELSMTDIIDGTLIELVDVNQDFIELGIDFFLKDDNIIKDIPIMGIVVSLIKTGVNIQNRIFAEKLFKFIETVSKGIVTGKEKQEYLKKMERRDYRQKVGGAIFSFLSNYNELEKANLLGKIFTNYILGKYDYDVFIEFANIVENMMISDIKLLRFLYKNKDRKYYLLGNVSIDGFTGKNEILVFSSARRLINLNIVGTQSNILYNNIENPLENMDESGYFHLDGKHMVVKLIELGELFFESII